MSFESPDIWLLGAKKANGLAAKQDHHALWNETRTFFTLWGVAVLFGRLALSFFGS